jgi:hypothetical protein
MYLSSQLSFREQKMCDQEPRDIFEIPDQNLSKLQERIEKLARKASKLGLTPPRLEILKVENRPYKERDVRGNEVTLYRQYHHVKLVGEAPTIPGWNLLGVVEHTTASDIGNVVRPVPGVLMPVRFRHADGWCDHCKTRRQRNETFVIESGETGQILQIGRNCLADFCRSPEAAANICAYNEWLSNALQVCEGAQDDDFWGLGARAASFVPTEAALVATQVVIRHEGWLSKSKAREQYDATGRSSFPTASIVQEALFSPLFWREDKHSPWTLKERQLRNDLNEPTDQDREVAAKALEWIRAKRGQADQLGDYLYNLVVVSSQEAVPGRHLGLLCSLLATYAKETAQITPRASQQPSRHLGEVGNKGTWQAKVTAILPRENSWGATWLVKFDVEGSTLTWWASNPPDCEVGDEVEVKGTVKGLGEFKGQKETTVTRCKVKVLVK